ncbi:extracellular catalytic domain type 1 short-chain-length polyhydroxyalkanoate depolymerase [Niallia sp. Krafla_26]|uniref:extracellular catalytic domain type 1 short-chain-length polyhydroxyalkanoate depolymerase n=1 Tax=Niallia sp. Krafla_26 TaxID=3064703 RepID=UPI003D16B847
MGDFKDYWYEGNSYKLFVPKGATKGSSLPVIVMLHGCKQDPNQFAEETKMNLLAEKENVILLYPAMDRWYNYPFDDPHEVNIDGCWNWFLDYNQHRGNGLPKMIVDMMDDAEKVLNKDYGVYINREKVYAAGLSAGGAMACILGVTYPDRFSGIAICSGLPYDAVNTHLWTEPWTRNADYVLINGVIDPYECGDIAFSEMEKSGMSKKMPVIVFHGISDTRVHPINGEQLIIQWAQTHFRIEGGQGKVKLSPSSLHVDVVKGGRSYTRHVYNGKDNTPLLELWQVHGMKHAWSGGSENGEHTDPLGPDAASIIWDFFNKDQ